MEPDARSRAVADARSRCTAGGIEPSIADDLEAAVRERRHRVVRDARGDAAGPRQVAQEGRRISIWSAPITPKTRESDDAAVRRARVLRRLASEPRPEVRGDDRDPAEEEGHRREEGSSRATCSGSAAAQRRRAARQKRDEITLFQVHRRRASEDLAAALLVWRSARTLNGNAGTPPATIRLQRNFT